MQFLVEPWEHQKKAIAQSFVKKDLALLWEMGTGKTATAINILRGRYAHQKRLLRTLIFAPPIVLRNWQREFSVHSKIPSRDIVVLAGNGARRVRHLKEATTNSDTFSFDRSRIILVNYEALQNKEIFATLELWQPEIIICDEAHRCKDYKGKRAQAVAKLADKAQHRYILTGTPILNTSMDIFMQYRILDGGETFGKNFFAFRGMYFEDENAAWAHQQNHFPKFVPRPGVYEQFQKRIYNKATRATKAECLDLPPLIRETRDVELSPEQTRMYNEMRDEFLTFIKAQEGKPKAVVAQLAITKALRLQQIVTGFAKDEHETVHTLEDVPRLKVLRELLEEIVVRGGHKCIVWARFKENYRQIKEVFESMGLGYTEIHGEVTASDKERNMKTFREDAKCQVMVANQRSGGVGVNLVEASYSIYYSKSFSLEDDLQSESRNHRGGSEIHEKITRIDLVSPGTIDELISEALRMKQNISDLILTWRI